MMLRLLIARLRRPRARHRCCGPCEEYGTLPGAEVFGRDSECTCGAGDFDELTLHAIDCDTVPCPFCHLADTDLPWPAAEKVNR